MALSGDKWTASEMPELNGKTAIVTGANSGLGFEATKKFAEKKARVIMACRNLEKAETAKKRIEEGIDDANLEVEELDLSDLTSVRDFAEEFKQKNNELHILCNNAGIMAIPRKETENGFEYQFGVNHLGHFALTAHLINLLKDTEGDTRVVTQSSGLHENGDIDFEDLMMEEEYNKWDAYAQSKLANVLFGYELDRKLKEHEADTKSVVCHPGYAATDLQYKGPEAEGSRSRYLLMKIANTLVAQSAEKGALPMLYAATSESIKGGEYIGPGGLMNMRGYPTKQESSDISNNHETAEKLWEISEELTDLNFNL